MKGNSRRLAVMLASVVVVALINAMVAAPALADYSPPYQSGAGSVYGNQFGSPYGNQSGSAYGNQFGCFYSVHSGETLSRIAARFGTSVYALMVANGIPNPNRIFAGTNLNVPCASNGYPSSCVRAVHIVRLGEDLFRIGLQFGVSPSTLAAFNGLANPNRIFAGMRLAIPCYGYAPGSLPGYMPTYPYGSPTYPYGSPTLAPTPTSGQALVVMQNLAFNPATITIHVGQTVVWRNQDSAPHTTTSGTCSGNTCTPMPGWDSGTLNPGQSFSHAFATAGTFTYYCRIHGAMMQGTVMVMP